MRSVFLKGINLKTSFVLFCLAPALVFAQGIEPPPPPPPPSAGSIDPPPAASINDHLVYLFVLALALAVFFFMKANRNHRCATTK
jgi:hypothetical protein